MARCVATEREHAERAALLEQQLHTHRAAPSGQKTRLACMLGTSVTSSILSGLLEQRRVDRRRYTRT